jgi:DUF4097 and DUF4098 domain-containing protein YvlB
MRVVLFSLSVACLLATASLAQEWEFSDVTRIRIDGVSGDLIIRPADGNVVRVQVEADVRPADAFEPQVEQDGKTLRIDEEWSGRNSSGRVEWTILLPREGETPHIRFSTASGDLDCADIAVRLDIDTASGDVTLANVDLAASSDLSTASGDYSIEEMTIREGTDLSTASGDIELRGVTIEEGCDFSTASGNVECINCTGSMELSSASGDVIVRLSEIIGRSEFSSASGDVRLELAKLPEEDLRASSASGDVHLDVDDFGDRFTLVMIKREDRGRIDCPFEFTSETTFDDHHHTYDEKTVERGTGGPEIVLRTASGRVVVKN